MNHRRGLLGVVGIWLTAGLALPFVNVLRDFTPEQLLVFRGFLTALMAFIYLRGTIGKVDKYTWLIAFTVPIAAFSLYKGVRSWGANPTIIIVTATPIVNLLISPFIGRKISSPSIIGLVLILGGVVVAKYGGVFQWTGFIWSVIATIANAVLYEWFDRAKAKPMQKCFYGSIGIGIFALAFSIGDPWTSIQDIKLLLSLLGFAFVGGLLYWIANLVTFENLPTNEASVLAQGETPAVIIGAYFLLGEKLTFAQWLGVGVSLFGAWYLSRSLK